MPISLSMSKRGFEYPIPLTIGGLLMMAGSISIGATTEFTAMTANTYYGTASYKIYVPSTLDVPTIKGVIFLNPGSGGDWKTHVDDSTWQEAARSLGCALIGAGMEAGYTAATESNVRASLDSILTNAAAATGRRELVNAPILSTGFSLGSFVSTEYAIHAPERTLAVAAYMGGSTYNAGDSSNPSAVKQVNTLWLPGETDSTIPPFWVSTEFQKYRSGSVSDGHAAMAINWRAGHTPNANQGWSMVWTWFAESIATRYPDNELPSTVAGNPLILKDVPIENGWLADKTTSRYDSSSGWKVVWDGKSPFLSIASYNDYSGDKANASWLPNETVARVYQAFNSYDGNTARTTAPLQGPLAIVGDAAPGTVVQAGQVVDPPQMAVWNVGSTIHITVDPREFDDIRSIVRMEYYDGSTLLGIQTTSTNGQWTLPHTLNARGIHSLTVVATDSAGNKTSAFRTVVAMNPYQTGVHCYGFEYSVNLLGADDYDRLNMNRKATVGSGPQMVSLNASGAGSKFPKQFRNDQGLNQSAAQFAVTNAEWLTRTDDSQLPTGTTPFTLEAFVNLASSGTGNTFRTIAGHGGSHTDDMAWQWIVTGESSSLGARNLVLQFTANGKGQIATSVDTIDSDLQLQMGTDYYLAVSITPNDTTLSGVHFYLKDLTNDGQLIEVDRTHTKVKIWNSGQDFTIGNNWNGSNGWDGLLDEVRLTNRRLANEELLVNQIVIPEPASLLGLLGLAGCLVVQRDSRAPGSSSPMISYT